MERYWTAEGDDRRPPRHATCFCTAEVPPKAAMRLSPVTGRWRRRSGAAASYSPNAPRDAPAVHRAHNHDSRRRPGNVLLQLQTATRAAPGRQGHRVVAHYPARDRDGCGTRLPRSPAVVQLQLQAAARTATARECHHVVAHHRAHERDGCGTRPPHPPSNAPPRPPSVCIMACCPLDSTQGGHRRRSR